MQKVVLHNRGIVRHCKPWRMISPFFLPLAGHETLASLELAL